MMYRDSQGIGVPLSEVHGNLGLISVSEASASETSSAVLQPSPPPNIGFLLLTLDATATHMMTTNRSLCTLRYCIP